MISYSEAFTLIQSEFKKLELTTESVPIEEALHRTLAEDVIADVFLPPFDNSAVDGYGIIFNEEIKNWNLIGEIAAGKFENFNLTQKQAVKIMTGAKLPAAITAVIPIEDVEVIENKINLKEGVKFKRGMNIRKKGSDVKQNEIAIKKGTYLRPRHLASAASCGKSTLKVFKKLKFAILATGDELIPVNQKPTGDKLRVSNVYSLVAEVLELNQTPVNLGFIGDDKNLITNKIKEILNSDFDVLITTGGVSVGDYDYLKTVYLELGVKEIFWRAYIKPGKPAFFGVFKNHKGKKLIFGLPGNPVSSQVNFKVYIKENVRQLFGQPADEIIEATLLNDVRKKDKKRQFLRGLLQKRNNEYFVTSNFSQSSGNIVQMGMANCLIVIEEEVLNPKEGDKVKCIPM